MNESIKKEFILANDVTIPCIGYGTWQTPDGETAVRSVEAAIDSGYRHIDAAAAYENEESVGEGIAKSGIERSELFITSKLWNSERGYQKAKAAFDKTLSDLRLDYLDLYLIHWPASPSQFPDWEEINLETWRAMTELYKEGKVRAIGVSNFTPRHLEALVKTEVVPMVNQIEYHPGCMQEETVSYCRKYGIQIEAWSPLGTGRVLSHPLLLELGKKYGKSAAQICIRWCLQNQVLPLPKSTTPSRIIENIDIFDFEISGSDRELIDCIGDFGKSGLEPDSIDF